METAQPSLLSPLLFLGMLMLFMYIFIIRPQSKRNKEINEMLNTLQVGSEVIAASGILGKVKNINTDPGGLDPYDFALRASEQTWREFAKPIPKPMFHGIYAASFREDLKIEGNHLVLMQNLRNFTVQFELLRQSGVPV